MEISFILITSVVPLSAAVKITVFFSLNVRVLTIFPFLAGAGRNPISHISILSSRNLLSSLLISSNISANSSEIVENRPKVLPATSEPQLGPKQRFNSSFFFLSWKYSSNDMGTSSVLISLFRIPSISSCSKVIDVLLVIADSYLFSK